MNIGPTQEERLRFSIRNLRRTSEWTYLKQLAVAESAEDEPDWQGYKSLVMELVAAQVDQEIESAMSRRAAAVGRP